MGRTAAAKPFGLEAAAEGVEELEHKPLDGVFDRVGVIIVVAPVREPHVVLSAL